MERDETGKVLEVAQRVAERYCRKYGVIPPYWDEIQQTAALIALESCETVPKPIEENLNCIARAVQCRLIDAFRHDKRRLSRERSETTFDSPENDDGAGILDAWLGAEADPVEILDQEQAKAKFWEMFDDVLQSFDETERRIITDRLLLDARYRDITRATGIGRKKIAEIVDDFKAEFQRRWNG